MHTCMFSVHSEQLHDCHYVQISLLSLSLQKRSTHEKLKKIEKNENYVSMPQQMMLPKQSLDVTAIFKSRRLDT